MNEYINKEHIRNIVQEHWDRSCGDGELFAFGRVLDEIDDAPVTEIKHGHWIDSYVDIVCSECKAEYSDEIIFMNRDFEHSDLNYCPNCGSRMTKEN